MDGVRRITHITDLSYSRGDHQVSLEDIFLFKQEKIEEDGRVVGDWVMNKKKPSFYEKFTKRNIKFPVGFFE